MPALPLALLLALSIGATPLSAQAATPPKSAEQTEPLQEWRGQYGGLTDAGAQVVKNATRWSHLWRSLGKTEPSLDFTTHFAVVAFAGEHPTGGFTIEFLEPVKQGEDLLIRWRVQPPPKDAYVTQAFAQPWKVKAFPLPKGKIKVEMVDE